MLGLALGGKQPAEIGEQAVGHANHLIGIECPAPGDASARSTSSGIVVGRGIARIPARANVIVLVPLAIFEGRDAGKCGFSSQNIMIINEAGLASRTSTRECAPDDRLAKQSGAQSKSEFALSRS